MLINNNSSLLVRSVLVILFYSTQGTILGIDNNNACIPLLFQLFFSYQWIILKELLLNVPIRKWH